MCSNSLARQILRCPSAASRLQPKGHEFPALQQLKFDIGG
jgi:hypothetical protein